MRVAYSECSRELRQIDINPAEKINFCANQSWWGKAWTSVKVFDQELQIGISFLVLISI